MSSRHLWKRISLTYYNEYITSKTFWTILISFRKKICPKIKASEIVTCKGPKFQGSKYLVTVEYKTLMQLQSYQFSFARLYGANSSPCKILIVPAKGWFGQPNYSTLSQKSFYFVWTSAYILIFLVKTLLAIVIRNCLIEFVLFSRR